MSEATRMAELYRSIYEGDDHGEAWHGPALKSLLKGITSGQASRSPQGKGHSILQLVLHMAYWEEIELRRFNGEVVDAPLNSPDDWPSNRKISDSGMAECVAASREVTQCAAQSYRGLLRREAQGTGSGAQSR